MAMIRFKFRVKYADGREVETTTRPKDLISFERHFGVALGSATEGSMEHLFYMAWVSLHNANKEPRDFDSWADVVDEVEQLEDDDEANPTNADQSND